MDNSEQYIKICDCPEVQGQWKPKIGDWIFRNYEGKSGFPKNIEKKIWPEKDKFQEIQVLSYLPSIKGYYVTKTTSGEDRSFTEEEYLKNGFIWLPRQDQIQEMINYCSTNFICGLYDWFVEPGGREDEFDSYEKLWLAYYMWEYHKKTWDGKKWASI